MADTEFDLGEALGGYEQAQADRNFYLSMVQGGTQIASPIAAYLAGVSGVKMANMRAKAQDIEDKRIAEKDALAATEKAQKRAMDLDNQIISIMKGARDGSIDPSAAAGLLGYAMKERGYIPKGYDADNNIMRYGVPGDEQDYQIDLGESETSKASRDLARIALQERKEERLAKAAADKAKIDEVKLKMQQKKLDDLVSGKANSSNTQEENRFLSENQGILLLINKPEGLDKFSGPEDRLRSLIEQDPLQGQTWLSGIETLSNSAKKRLAPITKTIAQILGESGLITQDEFDEKYANAEGDIKTALQSNTQAKESLDSLW